MDQETMTTLAKFGAVAALGLSAFGSALGCGTAGMAAIGAWKKAYLKGKNALFTLLIFVGAPIAQTIYGMLLMMYIQLLELFLKLILLLQLIFSDRI